MSSDSPELNEKHSHTNEEVSSSNFSQYYKNVGRTFDSNASQRRETFLNEHKEKHNALLDGNRDLSELFEESEVYGDGWELAEMDRYGWEQAETDGNGWEQAEMDRNAWEQAGMDVENTQQKNRKRIKFKMTMSEWLMDIPDDLEEKWFVKFCPEGKRRLIVANKRITKSFNKYGHLTSQFVSNLPGGGKTKNFSTQRSGMTVLDCVFNKETETFYILDILAWNSASFLDCEAQFRQCWIRGQIMDNPECFEAYGKDSFEFKVILDYKANRETIRSEMFNYDLKNNVACEGLLFYHKDAPYTMGQTPLITWLRPFMLPEMLNIDIPVKYVEKAPLNYKNQQSYLEKNNVKRKKRQGRSKKEGKDSSLQMETEEVVPVLN